MSSSFPSVSAAVDGGGDVAAVRPHSSSSRQQHRDVLSHKVARALRVPTESAAMTAALEALATLDRVDARSVRAAVEHDALRQAEDFRRELARLVDSVRDLRRRATAVREAAEAVEEAARRDAVGPRGDGDDDDDDDVDRERALAATLDDALRRRDEAARRVEAVRSFLERFRLDDADDHLLDHYDFDDDDDADGVDGGGRGQGRAFLRALRRVRSVREELERRFAARDDNDDDELPGVSSEHDVDELGTDSAVRMMENLADRQRRAHERLYRWLRERLGLTDAVVPTSSAEAVVGASSVGASNDREDERLDSALTSDPFVRDALRTSAHFPQYHRHVLESVASRRRGAAARRFLTALTAGVDGAPPMEVRAHDPVGYVGDMLAFAYRMWSVENDLVQGLFESDDEEDNDDDGDGDGGSSPSLRGNDLDDSVSPASLLSHVVGGVVRPLRARVAQVVSALARTSAPDDDDDRRRRADDDEDDARRRVVALLDVAGLLLFYRGALSRRGAAPDDPLLCAIADHSREASVAHAGTLRVHAAGLRPETAAAAAAATLEALSECRNRSPGLVVADDEDEDEDRRRLSLDDACDALLESAAAAPITSLEDAAELRRALGRAERAGLDGATRARWEAVLADRERASTDRAVDAATRDVLRAVGLGDVWEAFVEYEPLVDPEDPASLLAVRPGLSPANLREAFATLRASLYAPPEIDLGDALPRAAAAERRAARARTTANVVDAYRRLYDAVRSDKGGYGGEGDLGLEHTPEQVETLLSV